MKVLRHFFVRGLVIMFTSGGKISHYSTHTELPSACLVTKPNTAELGFSLFMVSSVSRGWWWCLIMLFSLSPLARENLILRDGFGPPVLRQARSFLHHTHSEPTMMASIHIIYANRHRFSPKSIGSRNCVPMAFTTMSPPAQGHDYSP